eukprot:6570270-Alexandrium_andersonii.AAC.1
MTMIKSSGLLWIMTRSRWMSPYEMLTAMGWPVDAACVERAGIPCIFSRGTRGEIAGRTRHSLSAA